MSAAAITLPAMAGTRRVAMCVTTCATTRHAATGPTIEMEQTRGRRNVGARSRGRRGSSSSTARNRRRRLPAHHAGLDLVLHRRCRPARWIVCRRGAHPCGSLPDPTVSQLTYPRQRWVRICFGRPSRYIPHRSCTIPRSHPSAVLTVGCLFIFLGFVVGAVLGSSTRALGEAAWE